jgi:hypothetical protein
MRLIDADALEKAIYKWMPKYEGTWMDGWISPIENLMILIMMTIQEQPTVDVEPVRHGEWSEHKDYPGIAWLCSECGYFTTMRTHYCPNCGAKMDGERKDNETN